MSAADIENFAVLVVDDNPGVRAMAVDMFEALGFTVLDSYNGDHALRLLAERADIRLLFADVRMPGMNGVELAEKARRLRPDVKIVLTSGYVDGAPVEHFPFLPKPYRVSDLAALVGGRPEEV
jgi:CheY-like chemotaxis protein